MVKNICILILLSFLFTACGKGGGMYDFILEVGYKSDSSKIEESASSVIFAENDTSAYFFAYNVYAGYVAQDYYTPESDAYMKSFKLVKRDGFDIASSLNFEDKINLEQMIMNWNEKTQYLSRNNCSQEEFSEHLKKDPNPYKDRAYWGK
ncbi:hypothetical protein [Dysgonomonas sp. Marseille-P4361]|uniref:hypothetical protein n=1 Tax=Dysgonomonas sp. Marseille-P4361 TaxID=2161820 RepID=UPI00135978AB|nr:hypothetical protein [Dysgonomonas sp. Marseille-P4361]